MSSHLTKFSACETLGVGAPFWRTRTNHSFKKVQLVVETSSVTPQWTTWWPLPLTPLHCTVQCALSDISCNHAVQLTTLRIIHSLPHRHLLLLRSGDVWQGGSWSPGPSEELVYSARHLWTLHVILKLNLAD